MSTDIYVINEMVKEKSSFVDNILNEASKVIVGQKYMLERILIALLSKGNILLEGVPGLAKTLTIKTIADIIQTDFKRIQFTPDLLPADLIGTMIYNNNTGEFHIKKGPIFSNIVLADEINRAPAKVQSALLEAMQEKQVTIGNETFSLNEPFIVLATQNPIEQEGTYPLPEAQVDRFMMKLKVSYPSLEEEIEVVKRTTKGSTVKVSKIITPEEINSARKVVTEVYTDDKILSYITNIIFATREPSRYNLDIKELIAYGASPRASIFLTLAAKAHAFLKHRGYVTPEDIKSVGTDILRHRIILTYEAEAEDISSEEIIQRIFDQIEVP